DLGVDVAADVEASARYAETHKPVIPKQPKAAKKKGALPVVAPVGVVATDDKPPVHRAGMEGPMQLLARAAEAPSARPDALEAFARYLATTGGDAKPEHKSRDLARRAAEAQPTVKRLLFAGQLAEGRNQLREWVDKAVALAGPKNADLDILLARAQLAQ